MLAFYVVLLASHGLVLDGFDQHFQASVHFLPLINLVQQHQDYFQEIFLGKNLGMPRPRFEPGAAGYEASAMQQKDKILSMRLGHMTTTSHL